MDEISAVERHGEALFQATFRDAPVAMSIVAVGQPDTREIVDANQAFIDLFGYARDQLIGMSPAELLHPAGEPADAQMLMALAAGSEVSYDHLVRGIRADGSVRWLQRHIGALDAAGAQNLLIGHVLDVTPQVEAEIERVRQQALDAALSAIRLAMLQGGSRTEGLRRICRASRDILDAETAMVVTPSNDGSQLAIEASAGIGQHAKEQMTFRADLGAVGEVFRTGVTKHLSTAVQPTTPHENRGVFEEHKIGPVILAPLPGGEKTVGVLVVSRLVGAPEFSSADHEPIGEFAAGAVAAIELANSRANEQRVEILEDRERLASEMHDTVIGRLFGTGMSLQSLAAHTDSPTTKRRILQAVEEIDAAVKEIRSTIFRSN